MNIPNWAIWAIHVFAMALFIAGAVWVVRHFQ